MDESGSLSNGDFSREKDFVADLASSFSNFGPHGVQMGIITFSTYADLDIKLNQFSSKTDFIVALRAIRRRGN